MKKTYFWITFFCGATCLLISGCNKKSDGVWDGSQSSAGYKYKHSQSLWGNDGEQNLAQEDDSFSGPSKEDFIPLQDEDLKSQFADAAIPQPKNDLGAPGSGLPSANQFQDPNSELIAIFHSIYFNTDDYIVRGQDSLMAVDKISAYLKDHPSTNIIIEGHCDERGPEAYNLSLGAKRANSVRTILVKKGVNPNQIHTISYGKERPIAFGHNVDAWTKNRRAQFKIHQ